MKDLADTFKIPTFADQLNKSLGLNTSAWAIVKAQEEFQRKSQPFYNLQERFNKIYSIPEMIRAGEIAAIHGLSKSIAWQEKFNIPSATMSALTLIQKQQEGFLNNSIGAAFMVRSNIAAAQMSNLHFAFNGISGKIATLAASQKQWGLIDEFEVINQQAIELTGELDSDMELSVEQSIAFSNLIETIVSFIKKNKKFAVYALVFIDVIIRIAALHQYADFLKTKPALATKSDLAKFQKKVAADIQAALKSQQEFKITARLCKIRLKPKAESMVIAVLPEGVDVIILEKKHRWVYISFNAMDDNIAETGWILKKYLKKP